jgi:CRISPR-associated protein Csd1
MILQALYDYYQRKGDELPRFGMEEKAIPFIIELAADGRPLGITDTRRMKGKKLVAQAYPVPQSVIRSSGVAANLLWDTAEYALGVPTVIVDKKSQTETLRTAPERLVKQHEAFCQRIAALPEVVRQDAGIVALLTFYRDGGIKTLEQNAAWEEIRTTNPNVSFRLQGDVDLICQRPALTQSYGNPDAAEDTQVSAEAMCLITGQSAPAERLHAAIKGVWGAQSSGANIVSFNCDAFASFNKEQGGNAPVSQAAAFAYTTALNHLLAKNSRQRMQVGDASTVFWAQKSDPEIEEGFPMFFAEPPKDDPDGQTDQVRALLASIHTGKFDGARGENRFYVLGLAPNAARIAVRLWVAAPLHEIAKHIQKWFDDLKMVHGPNEPEFPSLFRLLTACAVLGKADNIPPNLGGDILRAILSGEPFPATWLSAAVLRCRAEQKVTYLRAAAIKACLNRQRISSEKELQPMLDPDNKNPAYLLGRLFAALEKIQEEANPGLNATIRERYYGAASSTPSSVFPTLLRLKNHHLAKMANKGRVVNFERLLGEIVGGLSAEGFPAHLMLPEQGRFALGYYHQRQDFFSKKTSDPSDEGESK